MIEEDRYMLRCLHLAEKGRGNVAPNPMVGAVLVHQGRILGEGYHEQFGQAHAEVNCINNVSFQERHLISESNLYVSLEPCAHYGKTPPCADLIIANKISKVIIGCRDPFDLVDGRGIQKLKDAGIEVIVGMLESQCRELNKRFFTFHNQHRPYIILKWAQSANRKISSKDSERINISNELSNRLVHKWRSEEAAIMVGTNTAIIDDPTLTTRLWSGNNPVRILIDLECKVPLSNHLFNNDSKTIVFNKFKESTEKNILYKMINSSSISEIMEACYSLGIQSILVEGGAKTLQSFIDSNIWDEARVITNTEMHIPEGIDAPQLNTFLSSEKSYLLKDDINIYHRQSPTLE